jgi:hypothetical protein
MIKVRAKEDGEYGGYYRTGPQNIGTSEYVPGEVFEVDEKPYIVRNADTGEPEPMLDADGSIIFEMDNGKAKIGKDGKKIQKIRMASHFSPRWMERVNDDATVTNDYPPFQIPVQMRAKKAPEHFKEAIPVADGRPAPQLENVI